MTNDNLEPDVTSIAVEVGRVIHCGYYSARNDMIRVTYGSSRKSTQLGGMSSAPCSLREVAAELQAQGHLNEAGKRYAATAISRMLAS